MPLYMKREILRQKFVFIYQKFVGGFKIKFNFEKWCLKLALKFDKSHIEHIKIQFKSIIFEMKLNFEEMNFGRICNPDSDLKRMLLYLFKKWTLRKMKYLLVIVKFLS